MLYKILFTVSGLVFVSALVFTYMAIWTEGDISTNYGSSAVVNYFLGFVFMVIGTYFYDNDKKFR